MSGSLEDEIDEEFIKFKRNVTVFLVESKDLTK